MKVSQEILEAKAELHALMTIRGFWFFCYDADSLSVSVYDIHTKDVQPIREDVETLERIITTLLDAPNSGAPWRKSNYVCWQKGNVILEQDEKWGENFGISGIASHWEDYETDETDEDGELVYAPRCQTEDEASGYDIRW